MARKTDLRLIDEALRLRTHATGDTWVTRSSKDGITPSLTVQNEAGHDLEIDFSDSGKITKLVHWQPIMTNAGVGQYASRQPITRRKRQHVLDVIAGTWKDES